MPEKQPTEHIVTYEVKVRQIFYETDYGHLDGDLTPEVMAESDISAFENEEMTLEELFMSTDEIDISLKSIEPAP